MENRLFMRQSGKKRKERLAAIIKEQTNNRLETEEIHRIVKRIPLDRQLLVSVIHMDSDYTLKWKGNRAVTLKDGSCLIETENAVILCLVRSEE